MMESVTQGLQAWGVPTDRVHTEAFGPATVKQAVRGPTAQPDCGFDVTFERSGVTAQWSRCESPLLELAEEHSVAIDFGCRAGSCGTCVTKVLSGDFSYLHEPESAEDGDAPLRRRTRNRHGSRCLSCSRSQKPSQRTRFAREHGSGRTNVDCNSNEESECRRAKALLLTRTTRMIP